MRFSIAAVLGLAAFATAQSAAGNATSASSQVASMTTTSLSPQATCLARCGAADICCQAACVNVPCPNELQANRTTECAARCPQGSGTPSDTEKYAACQASCVSSYFYSSGTAGAAAATGTGASASATGGSTRTGSSSGSTASATQNAAPEVRFGAAGVGLIGLFIAGLAL